MKKSITFGLRAFVSTPCSKRRRLLAGEAEVAPAGPADGGARPPRARRACTPSHSK